MTERTGATPERFVTSSVEAAPIARTRVSPGLRVDLIVPWAVVTVAVIAAAVLRAYGLGAVGFNSDEAVYAGQAAALAGNPEYAQFFAIFRAHPLLVQFLLSLVFQSGVSDTAARMVSVAFGVAAIPIIYLLGAQLFNRRVGAGAALILAILPYHISVTRQVLLDGPETTLFLLTMLLLARYVALDRVRYLYVAAFAAGLTFLAKETAILVLPVAVAFILMTPSVHLGWRRAVVALLAFVVALSPYPISIMISNASGTARQFLVWQLLRRPNHTFTFYAEILPTALGWLLLLAAIAGVVLAIRRASWQDRLLLAWIFVPLIFFQFWPVKGYQYLLPITPALIIVACRLIDVVPDRLAGWLAARRGMEPRRSATIGRSVAAVISVALVASIGVASLGNLGGGSATGSLAGTGGLPGGREAGTWIENHVPEGAAFMTIGPTLSNLIQFYGHRRSQGLSVSPNPLHRNPAYDPIINPDLAIRTLKLHYAAWDIWSAARSPHFDKVLMNYVKKYNGVLVYEQKAEVIDAGGKKQLETVIRIYSLQPFVEKKQA
ncbi:MAG: hypothetical protein DLM71_07420 [Chloroflexi bacterium]|nr:MAG: hypothetical protein DLM71_07420 [Chloroflexota bacterium]